MIRPPNLQVVFFDLDGTLVDTEAAALRVVARYFESHGHTVKEKDMHIVVGHSWPRALEDLLSKYPVPLAPEEVHQQVLGLYRAELSSRALEIPGSAAAVTAISKVYRTALVSGSYRQDVLRLLELLGITSCFSAIFGFEDYPKPKPSPAPYVTAMQQLGITPQQALVFEDSWAGLESAHAAGLTAVGVRSTHQASPRVPIITIPDFSRVTPGWVAEVALK